MLLMSVGRHSIESILYLETRAHRTRKQSITHILKHVYEKNAK